LALLFVVSFYELHEWSPRIFLGPNEKTCQNGWRKRAIGKEGKKERRKEGDMVIVQDGKRDRGKKGKRATGHKDIREKGIWGKRAKGKKGKGWK
jgi:hypothetical protein